MPMRDIISGKKKLVFATGNHGKFTEAKKFFGNIFDMEMYSSGYPEVQTDELEDVVISGMDYLKSYINGAFMLDDTGLFIEHLNGFPGVYSAYVQKTLGNNGILRLLEGVKERRAYFKTVIGYFDGEKEHLFRGICPGNIAIKETGERGFGYDPIFVPFNTDKTLADMDTDEKNIISHRGRALVYMKEAIR